MSAPIKLYIDYSSQPSLAVLLVAKLKKLNFEEVVIDLFKGEHMTENYIKINPFKKVPYMVDSNKGINTSQSHTIMRHLCRQSPEINAHLYPASDEKALVKTDEYLDFHHLGIRKPLSDYLYGTVIVTLLGIYDESFDVGKGKEDAKAALTQFEQVFLKEAEFISGNQPSIADISAYFEINHLKMLNCKFGKWQRLQNWLHRLQDTLPQLKEASQKVDKLVQEVLQGVGEEKNKKFEIN